MSDEFKDKKAKRTERLKQLKTPGALRALMGEVKQKRSGISGGS